MTERVTDSSKVSVSSQTEEKHSNKTIIQCRNKKRSGEHEPRSKLPREIWRWLLGFSLKGRIKNVRRDFSNGYVIAQVLQHYYPKDIELPEYRNGDSLPTKVANWHQKTKERFSKELLENIDGTIHEKQGAAELLIIWLYESLTSKNVKTIEGEFNNAFTDERYQSQLPLYARNTASQAIKTNVRVTEEIRCPNLNTNKTKNELILDCHQKQKLAKKYQFPNRFEIVPTLAELCCKQNDTNNT